MEILLLELTRYKLYSIAYMSKQLLFSYGDFEDYAAMEAVLVAMREKGIVAEIEPIILGEEQFKSCGSRGYHPEVLRKIRRVKIFLKSRTKAPKEYNLPREMVGEDETAPHLQISDEQTEDEFFISRNLCDELELEFGAEETDDFYVHASDDIFIFEPKTTAPEAMFKTAEKMLEKLGEITG